MADSPRALRIAGTIKKIEEKTCEISFVLKPGAPAPAEGDLIKYAANAR